MRKIKLTHFFFLIYADDIIEKETTKWVLFLSFCRNIFNISAEKRKYVYHVEKMKDEDVNDEAKKNKIKETKRWKILRLSDLESDRIQDQNMPNYSVSRNYESKRNVCRFWLLILCKTISRRAIEPLDEIVVSCNHENLIILLDENAISRYIVNIFMYKLGNYIDSIKFTSFAFYEKFLLACICNGKYFNEHFRMVINE